MIRFLRPYCLFVAAFLALQPAMAQSLLVYGDDGGTGLIDDIRREVTPDNAAETLFEARRQARRAAQRAEAYLNSRGHFDPDISYSVEPGPPPRPALRVDPGPAFILGNVSYETTGGTLPTDVRDALDRVVTLAAGDAALPASIVAQEAGLLAALTAQGYADAQTLPRHASGDRDAATLDVTFRFDPGMRVVFGDVVYLTDPGIRQSYLDRLVPFKPGMLYTPDRLTSFNQRLSATRMFRSSAARLADEGVPGPEGRVERRDIEVHLKRRPRYTLLAGASYSSAEGAGVTGELTRRNLTRRGDTLRGQLTIAEQQRSSELEWRLPNVYAFDHTVAFTASLTEEETDAFDRDALIAGANYEIRHSKALTTSVGVSAEFTREIDAFEQRDAQILSASAAARLDMSNDPLDPSKGWRADLRVEPATVGGDASANFIRVNAQLSAYQPLSGSGRFVAAGRVRGGAVYGATISDIPVSRRFFAGGGSSARGFEYQSVGPKNADGQPTGGRSLFEASGELRYRPDKGIGGVVFVDAATVSLDRNVDLGDLRTSAGIGVRYGTPIGPIRFDIAAPFEREPGDDPYQIYVSIGQAF